MIGSYVRMVTSPEITGKIRAAHFDKGGSVFLFHPHPHRVDTCQDTWLPESAFEECAPPKDVLIINDKLGDLLPKYFRMVTAPHTRMGTIKGVRFDGDVFAFCFVRTLDLRKHFMTFGCQRLHSKSALDPRMNRLQSLTERVRKPRIQIKLRLFRVRSSIKPTLTQQSVIRVV